MEEKAYKISELARMAERAEALEIAIRNLIQDVDYDDCCCNPGYCCKQCLALKSAYALFGIKYHRTYNEGGSVKVTLSAINTDVNVDDWDCIHNWWLLAEPKEYADQQCSKCGEIRKFPAPQNVSP